MNKTLPDPRAFGREKGFGRLASPQLCPSTGPPRSPSLARLAHLPQPASLISPGPPRSLPQARLAPLPWPASLPFQARLAPLPGLPRPPFQPASLRSSGPLCPRPWPASLPSSGPPRSPSPPPRLIPASFCTGIPGPARCLTSSRLSSLPCTAPHPGQPPDRGSDSSCLRASLAPRPALPQPQPRRLSPRPRAFGLEHDITRPACLWAREGVWATRITSAKPLYRPASLPFSGPPRSSPPARLAHLPRPASLPAPGPPCSPPQARLAPLPWPALLPFQARLAPLLGPPRSSFQPASLPSSGPLRSRPWPASLPSSPCPPRRPASLPAPGPPCSPSPPQRLIPAPRCTGIPGPARCLTSSRLSSLPCTAPHPGQPPSRGSDSPRLRALLAPRPALPQPQPRRLSPRPRAFGLEQDITRPACLWAREGVWVTSITSAKPLYRPASLPFCRGA